ncbi:MAG: PKD domain-containing protein [Deltaproteobacteria bacterium]|nr:PKD domain-containing protein [Deltaproteobacteria bacterium]
MLKIRFFIKSLVLAALLAAFSTPAQSAYPWPGVTFSFDDGYSASMSIARPLFKQYNVVATTFPIVYYIGIDSEEVSWDQLRGLLSDGWEIGSHSMTHPNLTSLSSSQLDYELRQSKSLLETNLNIKVYSFAIPGGAYNQTVLNAIAKYYHFARNVDYPFDYNHLPPVPFTINCYEAYNNTTASQIIQWIETARSNNYWLVLTFHRVNQGNSDPYDEYSFGTTPLTQVLQYIQSHGYPTPTFTQVFQQFPPTANAGSNQTVNQGATVTLNGSGSSDPCAQTPLTYAWNFQSKPAGSNASLSGANTVNPSFTADMAGSYAVQLVVTNSLGVASTAATVTITANATGNSPPVANAGPDQTVAQGALVTLDGSGSSDPNGDTITYAWSFTSEPAGSTATLSNSTSVHPSFTADNAGSYVVQLVVTDSHGAASTPDSVTISTQNSPPVANAGPAQTVSPGALVTLDGSGSSDPNGDTLTYAWSFTSKPTGSTATLSGSTTVHPTFTADKAGSYVVRLIVTDSQGTASNPDSVTISTQNSPPVANAGPNQTVALGALVTLDGSGSSDPDGDTITYAWSFTSKPAGSTATLSNSTIVNPTFTADKDGDYVLQLIVTDSHGLASSPSSVTVSTQNSAPVANAGPNQTVALWALVTLNGSLSSDPDGDTITYLWSFTSKPVGSTAVLNNPTAVNPSFTADKDGSYVVQLIVTDSHGAASTPATVTISTQNAPPVANAGPAQTVSVGALVTMDGSLSSDPDGDTITYAWSFASKPAGSTATLANATTVQPTFTADLTGSYVVQLIVTDSHGAASSPATVTITAGSPTPVVIDSYSETNRDDYGQLDNNMRGWGQAFTGNGASVTSAKFYLQKSGSPTGSAYAKIYAVTGTFGSSAKPAGAALATSSAVTVSTIPTSYSLVQFNFPTPYKTTNATRYVVTVEYTGGTASNIIRVGLDLSSPTHAGNLSYNWAGTWYPYNSDVCFYVYGTP